MDRDRQLINLDANASLGVCPQVWEQLCQEGWFGLNPSSIHQGGQRARAIIEESRDQISEFLGLSSDDHLIFTSGATEANSAVFNALLWRWLKSGSRDVRDDKPYLITTVFEHSSVLAPAERVQRFGIPTRYLNSSPSQLIAELASEPLAGCQLVSVMAANNEVGFLFPIKELVSVVRERAPDCWVHSDLVQLVGKQQLSFSELGVDLAALSGHKIGAMPGVGGLVLRGQIRSDFEPLILGGPQEEKLRAGTENVLGIRSLALAVAALRGRLAEGTGCAVKLAELKGSLVLALQERLREGVIVNGFADETYLPNTVNLRFVGVRADDLVVALDRQGILISSGAACSSGKPNPSHVLLALGLTPTEARESVRISLPPDLDSGLLPELVEKIAGTVLKIRSIQGS